MRCPACGAENQAGAEVCFTCREVLRAISQGTIIGSRYEIDGILGRGGMGTVYRARDLVLDEAVALKVLRPEIAATAEMAERFRSEIRLARRVSHPNVCRIHEYAEEGSLRYISMELVQGTTLKALLGKEGRLPPAQAADLAIQVAQGLSAIHRVGIVHRDVKSLNIMVDAEGTAKVMDFGIAKRVAADGAADPATGYVVGSPEYMSPEQARGRRVDSRSDIYSLGIVLYEMLTGSVPFRGDTAVATLLMHIEKPPPLNGGEGRELPPSMLPVLRRSLAKDPAARFDSAHEMAEALRQPDAMSARSIPSVATGKGRWAGAALVLTAAGALALAIGLKWRSAPSMTRSLPPSASVAPGPIHTPSLAPAPTEAVPTRRPAAPTRPEAPRASPTPSTAPPTTTLATPPPTTVVESTPAPSAAAREAERGFLTVTAIPWADVRVDGELVGQTPLRFALDAGVHAVLLTHPDYEPYPRRVRIPAAGTFRLVMDWQTDGVRRR